MQKIFKSFGSVAYFFFIQCFCILAYAMFKLYTDTTWADQLYSVLMDKGIMSTEYLTMIAQICIPVLIVADGLMIIPLMIYSRKSGKTIVKKLSAKSVMFLVSMGLVLNFIVSAIVDHLPKEWMGSYSSLTNMLLSGNFIGIFLSSAIIAPIAEELIFRFVICGCVYKDDVKKGIIISSIMFGIAHMNPVQSSYAFILGLILAVVYVKSNYNLLTTIILHIAINGSSVMYEYLNHIAILVSGTIIVLLTAFVYRKEILKHMSHRKIY